MTRCVITNAFQTVFIIFYKYGLKTGENMMREPTSAPIVTKKVTVDEATDTLPHYPNAITPNLYPIVCLMFLYLHNVGVGKQYDSFHQVR